MPYIDQSARVALDRDGSVPRTVGELTYTLTRQVIEYVAVKGVRFATYADVLAALDATAREFYRRQVAPYEDEKIAANGDVYP